MINQAFRSPSRSGSVAPETTTSDMLGVAFETTLGWMAANDDRRFTSATFFTSIMDFKDAGELTLFVDEEQLQAGKELLEAQIDNESSALYATGRVWDDGIIHPADSRTVLGLALSAAHSNAVQGATEYGVWRH